MKKLKKKKKIKYKKKKKKTGSLFLFSTLFFFLFISDSNFRHPNLSISFLEWRISALQGTEDLSGNILWLWAVNSKLSTCQLTPFQGRRCGKSGCDWGKGGDYFSSILWESLRKMPFLPRASEAQHYYIFFGWSPWPVVGESSKLKVEVTSPSPGSCYSYHVRQ